MPTSMSFDEYLAVIEAQTAALLADAGACSMTDPVPTCPGWTVADLLKHHGGVCRWAGAIIRDGRTANLSDAEMASLLAAPTERDELLAWYADGRAGLIDALRSSVDGPMLVFLRDAPAARLFWARRCAHESTIHRVDALSAVVGHLPTTASAGIPDQLALDGIDELLLGFVPRRSSALRADEPITVTVSPTDTDRAWTVVIGTGPPVSSIGATKDSDAVLTGSAAGVYLGLWNRGDEIAEHGPAPVLGLWRDKVRVSWA